MVLVNFRYPDDSTGHYALVQAISDSVIVMSDPFSGPHSIMQLKGSDGELRIKDAPWFDWRSEEDVPGWYLGVKHREPSA